MKFEGVTVLLEVDNNGPDFRYIVADDYVKGNYLLVFGYAIYTTSDFVNLNQIGGDDNLLGYVNGDQKISRFRYVNGIATSPISNKYIWISDQGNGCFRTLNRENNYTTVLTGNCNSRSIIDGKFAYAGVAFPFGMAVSLAESSKVYFYESRKGTVRCLLKVFPTWYVRTVDFLDKDIYGLTFDPLGSYLYFSRNFSVIRVSSTWKSAPETLISEFGHNDGALGTSSIKEPRYLHFLDDNNFLLADYSNHVLRLISINSVSVSSICIPQTNDIVALSGPIDTCKLQLPRNFVVSRESSKIYIIGDYSIYSLEYSGEFLGFYHLVRISSLVLHTNFKSDWFCS